MNWVIESWIRVVVVELSVEIIWKKTGKAWQMFSMNETSKIY